MNASLPVKKRWVVDYVRRTAGRSVTVRPAGAHDPPDDAVPSGECGTISAVHIPLLRGVAPTLLDLMGGQTQAILPGLAAAVPHIHQAGAAAGDDQPDPAPAVQDLPTLDESGRGFDAQQWYGVVGGGHARTHREATQ
jgi:tripartite-type tricarboxylate transporter receptor subunit TctC